MRYWLKRFWFAFRLARASWLMGWRMYAGMHAEAQRIKRELAAGADPDVLFAPDPALYDEVLEQAGTGVLRRAFDE